ncbi:Hsp70 family protein [Micromonospora sp. NPDC048999]|uniref:Hsp70 family protein n=1 Tax=Micromonospora sp. NPDC048999 TaxID=3155391 RepID=UPI003405368F
MPMAAGEARLAIDCGTASTVAVLAWRDGSSSLLSFDGMPYLPTGVYLSQDGELWTGRRAWQAAADQPARFIPNPRRPVDEQITVDGSGVDSVEAMAATLRRVAGEAERMVGGPVADVRLVVPAGWGPRRRTWLRQVAHRAGLARPRLVEAPVAVADHLLASGLQVPVGSFIVVCDVGAGAEVSVLRRGPAGFEVLATLADPDAGGGAVDRALAASLIGGQTSEGEGWWAVAASVQAAKEALTAHPAVTVPLPDRPPVVATSVMAETAARPVVERVAQLVGDAITAAELVPSDVAGIWCVGGSAHLPQLQALLTERTGVAALVVAEPTLAAALGAAEVGAASPDSVDHVEVAVPPVRRAAAIAVPGLASLALLWQFVVTAEVNNALYRVHYWVLLNWGELAVAAVFAVLACLSAGTVLGSLIAAHSPTAEARSEGGKVSVGIVAAVSLGVAIAGMYAVLGSQYFKLPLGGFLPWALWPITPIVLIAVAMAVVAARQWRAPHGGWTALLAAPTGSVVAAAAGTMLIQYSMTATRWPRLVLWIDLAGRLGGLLLGVGVVMAVVSPLVLRLILGVPLTMITASIVSWRATGILGVFYAIAIAFWWAARLWTRIIRPATPTPRRPASTAIPGGAMPPAGGR